MAGLYIHIPFCKKLCYYCDFHFTVSLKTKDSFLNAVVHEIEMRKGELHNEPIKTVYFGGGTPSVLTIEELRQIVNALNSSFDVSNCIEFSIELNPDDVTNDYLNGLKDLGFNRVSMGVQSFNNDLLKFLNRRHSAEEAQVAVAHLKNTFDNYTIDLIYGIPSQTIEHWANDLDSLKKINPPHFSAYQLGIEDKSVFGKWQKQNKFSPADEKIILIQYNQLIDFAWQQGYEHYEISNFCKPSTYSMHNKGYWTGEKYLGFGPSAHSYLGNQRMANVNINEQYIQRLISHKLPYEVEVLRIKDIFNDLLLTGFRTIWGISMADIDLLCSNKENFMRKIKPFIEKNWVVITDTQVRITEEGMLLTDFILRELFE